MKEAKEVKEVKNQIAVVETVGTEIINISEDMFLTTEQMDALLSSKDTIEEKLSTTYLKGSQFALGEERKFIFRGFKNITNAKGEPIKAVVLYGENEKKEKGLFVNAARMIVSDLEGVDDFSVIGLIYKGKKPAKSGGEMDVFSVSRYHHVRK